MQWNITISITWLMNFNVRYGRLGDIMNYSNDCQTSWSKDMNCEKYVKLCSPVELVYIILFILFLIV